MPIFRDGNCDDIGISFTENLGIINSKHTPGISPKSICFLAQVELSFNIVTPKYSFINTLAKWPLFLNSFSLIPNFEGYIASILNSNNKNYFAHITRDYSELTPIGYQYNSYYRISLNKY